MASRYRLKGGEGSASIRARLARIREIRLALSPRRFVMATPFQVTFDSADPEALSQFWAAALGYIVQPPPEGFADWTAFLRQRKNRMHLDLNVSDVRSVGVDEGRKRVGAEVERLVALGAKRVREFDEAGEYWIVMTDPEGNEFCVQ